MKDMVGTIRLLSVNTSVARPLMAGSRKVLSGIGKRSVPGPVAVHPLGLEGDEQADPAVHGGLAKAVYAYPVEHYAYWQARRQAHHVSLFEESLPPGFAGENLTLQGVLEHQIWVGDELHFDRVVLRVTEPRQPCFKFAAVMGYPEAARDMLPQARCGFYLAVVRIGTIHPGDTCTLVPGRRALGIPEAFAARRAKHLR